MATIKDLDEKIGTLATTIGTTLHSVKHAIDEKTFTLTRYEQVLTTPITSGSTSTVHEYTVGANTFDVYLDGVKCRRGDTYSEVGTSGEKSTTIKWNNDITSDMDVEVVGFTL